MRIGHVTLWILAGLAAGHGLLLVLLLPDWPPVAHVLFALGWVAAVVAGWMRLPRTLRPWLLLAAGAIAFLRYAGVAPRTDRVWAMDHAQAPAIKFSGDNVHIGNFRGLQFRDGNVVPEPLWLEKSVDLTAVRSVDYIVEPFSAWRGIAHTFLSFGFADGTHVAISVEARREADEDYSMLRGLFRHFEMIYVIGEERDLVGRRANLRGHPVHVFPIATTPEVARELFVSMLQRTHQRALYPEFYHSLHRTCTVAVLDHVNEVRDDRISGGWRVLFPGYSDRLAWEIGLVGFSGSLDEARARFLINERSAFLPELDDAAWSRQIRGETAP